MSSLEDECRHYKRLPANPERHCGTLRNTPRIVVTLNNRTIEDSEGSAEERVEESGYASPSHRRAAGECLTSRLNPADPATRVSPNSACDCFDPKCTCPCFQHPDMPEAQAVLSYATRIMVVQFRCEEKNGGASWTSDVVPAAFPTPRAGSGGPITSGGNEHVPPYYRNVIQPSLGAGSSPSSFLEVKGPIRRALLGGAWGAAFKPPGRRDAGRRAPGGGAARDRNSLLHKNTTLASQPHEDYLSSSTKKIHRHYLDLNEIHRPRRPRSVPPAEKEGQERASSPKAYPAPAKNIPATNPPAGIAGAPPSPGVVTRTPPNTPPPPPVLHIHIYTRMAPDGRAHIFLRRSPDGAIASKKLRKNVLLIGLGGASFPAPFLHKCADSHLTVVDISRPVIELSRKFFGLAEIERKFGPRLSVVKDDALSFLQKARVTEGWFSTNLGVVESTVFYCKVVLSGVGVSSVLGG